MVPSKESISVLFLTRICSSWREWHFGRASPFIATCSTAEQPPRTIKSAIETFLPVTLPSLKPRLNRMYITSKTFF
jgi:hypothetical protein